MQKQHELIPFNLQLFASDELDDNVEDVENPEGNENQEEPENTDGDEKNISQAELQRRLKAEKAKHEKDMEQLKARIEEERRREKLSDAEKKELEEADKNKELENLKSELNRMRMTTTATNLLSSKGLYPSDDIEADDVLSFVVREDEDKTKSAVLTFEKMVNGLVNQKLKEKARTGAPENGTSGSKQEKRGEFGASLAKKTQVKAAYDPFARK